jgi:hypothetical protein
MAFMMVAIRQKADKTCTKYKKVTTEIVEKGQQ